MGLKNWARQKNRELHRQAMEDRDSRLWHSHFFHRYFEGYTEYTELSGNGKEHIRREYTAAYLKQDISQKRAVLTRILYVVLLLMMVSCVVLCARTQGSLGISFYVVIPQMGVLALLMWLSYVLLVNYLFAPKKMTIHDHHSSSVLLLRISIVLSMVSAFCGMMELLEGAVRHVFSQSVLPCLLFLLAAVCAMAINRVEKRIPYIKEENPHRGMENGTVINGST